MKNCVVALSINFSSDYLKPFIKSFIDNVNGHLYLITDHNTNSLPVNSDKIKLINIFEITKKYKVFDLTPYNLKPVLFYLVLKEIKNKLNYDSALITDVDVIFQKDPFEYYNKNFSLNDIVLSEEKKFYKDCETNSIWYKKGYNSTYAEIKNKKILNCGVTIGPLNKIIDYQKKVTDELSVVLSRQNYFAYDQVILNHLTYISKSISFLTLSHFNDFIIHFAQEEQIEDLTEWKIDEHIINPQTKNPFIIIHQYDKNKKLKDYFIERYR